MVISESVPKPERNAHFVDDIPGSLQDLWGGGEEEECERGGMEGRECEACVCVGGG